MRLESKHNRAALDALLERRVVLVTGKGGVGRTTVTAALARAGARAGRRVLVTEIREPTAQKQSALARHFDRPVLEHDPISLAPGIDGVMLQSERGTELFLRSVLRVQALARLAIGSAALLRLLHAAPSFHEMGIYNHLLSLLRARRSDGSPQYDIIVMDMPATGHALAMTGLPAILLRLVPSGPIAAALREGQSILNDPKTGAAYVVTLPELLPVTETLELIEGLRENAMTVGGVVVNRMPQDPFTAEERLALGDLLGTERVFGRAELDRISRAGDAVTKLARGVTLSTMTVSEHEIEGSALVSAIADELFGEATS